MQAGRDDADAVQSASWWAPGAANLGQFIKTESGRHLGPVQYDHAEQQDLPIIKRVAELAEKHNVKMSQIALAWQWAKGVTTPIVGATREQYLDDAAQATEITLTPEEVAYLDEPYTAHEIVGALDSNPDGLLPKDVK